mmetsp:Transcript_26223/g.38858  ORF Transcript_26223/g.38858 Transcript_26223/m.38858 type:complete len:252 (+) Transcript_26223:2312-3067(+)
MRVPPCRLLFNSMVSALLYTFNAVLKSQSAWKQAAIPTRFSTAYGTTRFSVVLTWVLFSKHSAADAISPCTSNIFPRRWRTSAIPGSHNASPGSGISSASEVMVSSHSHNISSASPRRPSRNNRLASAILRPPAPLTPVATPADVTVLSKSIRAAFCTGSYTARCLCTESTQGWVPCSPIPLSVISPNALSTTHRPRSSIFTAHFCIAIPFRQRAYFANEDIRTFDTFISVEISADRFSNSLIAVSYHSRA